MKTFSKLSFAILLPLLIACQKGTEENVVRSGQEDATNAVVQAADGTGYSVQCLRQNAAIIQQQGKSALDTCQVNISGGTATAVQNETRGKFFTSNYAWVYYPPTYINPNSYTYSYPSTYNAYNDTSYYNNPFSNWVFGGNYNINCNYVFGYTNPTYSSTYSTTNYSSYYNSACSGCLFSNKPNKCANRCNRYYSY